MFRWALAFLILALVAAVFTSVGIARVLFLLFLVVFLVTLVLGLAAEKQQFLAGR